MHPRLPAPAPRRLLLSSAVAAALCLPMMLAPESARAQESDENRDTTSLGEVTVTARKREETIQDVPVAVTA